MIATWRRCQAWLLGNIAESLREQGRYDEALVTMRRVEALQ